MTQLENGCTELARKLEEAQERIKALEHENHNLNWALGADGYSTMYTPEEQAEADAAHYATMKRIAGMKSRGELVAGLQARIKVLEVLLRECTGQPSIENALHKKIREALSTTSNTEALDRVVRESRADELEQAAEYLDGDGAHFDDVQTLRERAEAIRKG